MQVLKFLRRKPVEKVLLFLFIIAILILQKSLNLKGTMSISLDEKDNIQFLGVFRVLGVTDGDTITVVDSFGRTETVRFLAVDTLEVKAGSQREKCLGKMATDFTKEKLNNKRVELFTDKTQTRLDKYGRTLAYVRVMDKENKQENIFFNEELLSSGIAKVYIAKPPAALLEKYKTVEKKAKMEKLGIWNLQTCTEVLY
jgi:micrococcal nuclease